MGRRAPVKEQQMKISKSRIQEIIQEEIVREINFRTGVPEEDVLAHGLDLDK